MSTITSNFEVGCGDKTITIGDNNTDDRVLNFITDEREGYVSQYIITEAVNSDVPVAGTCVVPQGGIMITRITGTPQANPTSRGLPYNNLTTDRIIITDYLVNGKGIVTFKAVAAFSGKNGAEHYDAVDDLLENLVGKYTEESAITINPVNVDANSEFTGSFLGENIMLKGAATVIGAEGNDYISGSTGADTIYGDEGNDNITGGSGNDTLYGGEGDDTISTGTGNDTVYGNSGDDYVTTAYNNNDVKNIYLGSGEDTVLAGGSKTDTITNIWVNADNSEDVEAQAEENIIKIGGNQGTINIKDATNLDTLDIYQFTSADFSYERTGENKKDLTITKTNNNNTQTIVLEDHFTKYQDGTQLDKFVIGEDETSLIETAQINVNLTNELSYTATDDYEENITAANGNYTITLGKNTNVLSAGDGNNTVICTSEDGFDKTILLGKGSNTVDISNADENSQNIITIQGHSAVPEIEATEETPLVPAIAESVSDVSVDNGTNTITVTAGKSVISVSGNNSILTAEGNDQITVNSGMAAVDAGKGDDIIEVSSSASADIFGREGKDKYIITGNSTSDNVTVIEDIENGEEIVFNDILISDLTYLRSNFDDSDIKDLCINYESQTVLIKNYFTLENVVIKALNNENILSEAEITDLTLKLDGTEEPMVYECNPAFKENFFIKGSVALASTNSDNKITLLNDEDEPAEEFLFLRTGNNLVVNDSLVIQDFFKNESKIEKINDVTIADSVINVSMTKTSYSGNDFMENIIGTNGSDTINSSGGDDMINAKKGNDKLNGGSGNNTYIFSKGDGNDTVYLSEGNDTLKFYGIQETDIFQIRESGKDIIIKYGNNDTVTVKDFLKGEHSVKSLLVYASEFGEEETVNTKYTIEDLSEDPSKYLIIDSSETSKAKVTGSVLSETIIGSNKNNTIKGGGGDDIIYAWAGNNKIYTNSKVNEDTPDNATIYSGTGNDTIITGKGNDRIIINKGHGNDTVVANSSGMTILDYQDAGVLSFKESGKNLIITNTYDVSGITGKNLFVSENLTVKNYLKNGLTGNVMINTENGEENLYEYLSALQAANGNTIILGDSEKNKKQKLNGSFLDETIYGGNKNDKITSGTGIDTVISGKGNDKIYGYIATVTEYDDDGKVVARYKDYVDEDGLNAKTYKFNVSYQTDGLNNIQSGSGKGDGSDKIYNAKASDIIVFDVANEKEANYIKNNIKFTRKGNDLVIQYNTFKSNKKTSADKITLVNHFKLNEEQALNTIKFNTADESDIEDISIKDQVMYYTGKKKILDTYLDDIIQGSNKNDSYNVSKGGKDKIFDNKGNDTYTINLDNVKSVVIDDRKGKDTVVLKGTNEIIFGINIGLDENGNGIIYNDNLLVFGYNEEEGDFQQGYASIDNYFSTGLEGGAITLDKGGIGEIEKFKAEKTKISAFDIASINNIKTNVQQFLKENDYTNTVEVLTEEKSDGDIQALIAIYQDAASI